MTVYFQLIFVWLIQYMVEEVNLYTRNKADSVLKFVYVKARFRIVTYLHRVLQNGQIFNSWICRC